MILWNTNAKASEMQFIDLDHAEVVRFLNQDFLLQLLMLFLYIYKRDVSKLY